MTSAAIRTAIGLQSFVAGSNFQVLTASITFLSKADPTLFVTFISWGLPSGETTKEITATNVDFTLSVFCSSGVSFGKVRKVMRGAFTPLPT